MCMKLYLNNFLAIFVIFFFNISYANNFITEYKVSTAGIKIGYFNWSLNINNDEYLTEINLKNSGIFSNIYKFNGRYISRGVYEDNTFKSKEYEQYWKTKNKTKIVNLLFDDYLIELKQKPEEKELARINLGELFLYFDPITSFINILNGSSEANTIDGRRVYTFKKNQIEDGKIVLKIENYQNIWADHKRNDLEKIEFFIKDGFLPFKIYIYFKKRVFKLQKI